MLSVHEAINISYSCHLRCPRWRDCQKDVSHLLGWLLTYMVRSPFQYCPSIWKIYLDYRNILYRYLSPLKCHKLTNNVSVPSGCSEEWAIIGMTRYISEQLWDITCNKTVVGLSYKWNDYFQLLWIGLLVTIPYVALQFRRNLVFWNPVPGR